jgi:hypothetical protein
MRHSADECPTEDPRRRHHRVRLRKNKILGQTPQDLEPARLVARIGLGWESSPPQGQFQGQRSAVTDAIRIPSKIKQQLAFRAKGVTERMPVSQISSNASKHFYGALHGVDRGQGMAARRSCRRLTRV